MIGWTRLKAIHTGFLADWCTNSTTRHVPELEVLYFNHIFLKTSALHKIMVTTGTPWPSSTKTEVLDLENENLSCSNLSPFPLNVWGAVGSHLSLAPIICGGYIGRDNLSDRCFKYRLFLIRSMHYFLHKILEDFKEQLFCPFYNIMICRLLY